jgi:transcriptional regulator GlxA family with amidase domain
MRAPVLTTAAAFIAVGVAFAPLVRPDPAQASAADQLVLPAPRAGHARPLVVIVADNAGAEVTDFTIPYGVLKDSGLFEVRSLSTAAGPVQLMMSIKVMADQTLAQFDVGAPEGADIVIVPAQMDPKNKALIAWVQAQAAKGATIVSICEGARVLAKAGLLDDKRATTHWHALKGLEKAYPRTTWVRDRRYVQDGRIISTTGVSASIPVSLAMVEAVGGRAAAQQTAARIGVSDWSATHRTADFHVSRTDFARAATAMLARWTHETVELPLVEGQDEIALALRADAWARSYKTKVVTTSAGRTPVRSRHGLAILPDERPQVGRYVVPTRPGPAIVQLEATLGDMHRRYGPLSVRLAKLGMEYGGRSPAT